jgi:purine-cytosine permease-like protein
MEKKKGPSVILIFIGIFMTLFLLFIFPILLSLSVEYISKKWEFFPEFSRPKFFEEYYKLLGTFITMIIGFYFADYLIEKRIDRKIRPKANR